MDKPGNAGRARGRAGTGSNPGSTGGRGRRPGQTVSKYAIYIHTFLYMYIYIYVYIKIKLYKLKLQYRNSVIAKNFFSQPENTYVVVDGLLAKISLWLNKASLKLWSHLLNI